MISLKTQFRRSLWWNTFESLAYQGIFIAHHGYLFTIIPTPLYGIVGTLFSVLYLTVSLITLGFEASLGTFFTVSMQSKQHCNTLIIRQSMYQLLVTTLLTITGYTTAYNLLPNNHVLTPHLTPLFGLLLCTLMVSECCKKVLRTILQLAFNNKKTATTEVATLLGYVSMVWLWYAITKTITLYTLFVPLLIISTITNTVLTLSFYQLYQSLPATSSTPLPNNIYQRMVKNRVYTWLHQVTQQLFSSNALVLFFASMHGMAFAGVFKLISSTAHSIASIIHKMFGLTSEALFARVKGKDLSSKQKAFSLITNHLYHAIIGVIIFIAINHQKIIAFNTSQQSTTHLLLLILLLVINTFENFFIAYERFYTTQEEAHYLVIPKVISLCALGGMVFTAPYLTTFGILYAIVATRIAVLASLSYLSFYRWHLVPSWRLSPSLIAYSLFGALAFFMFV